jgi:AbrB family looped-hinge helix DNA binding protein
LKVTTKGQVTIPHEIREELGIYPNTEVEFRRVGDAVEIRKIASAYPRGRALVERLRGRGAIKMSTDEIMALTRDEEP